MYALEALVEKTTLTLEIDNDVYEVIRARAQVKRRPPEREAKYILMRAATGQNVEPLAGVRTIDSLDYLQSRFAEVGWDASWLERNAAERSTDE